MKLLELREKRMSLVKEAQSILTAAPDSGMSVEDEKRFDGLMGEADTIKRNVEKAEAADEETRDLEAHYKPGVKPDTREDTGDPEAREKAEKTAESRAFTAYLRGGASNLKAEQRAILEKRALVEGIGGGPGSGTTGGYLVPQDFYRKLTEALKWYGGMRISGATVIQTSTGATMPFPTENDTTQIGAILAENTAATEADMSFGVVNLAAYNFTSKIVTVPKALVQDSAFDLDSYIARKLGIRIGRIQNNMFTVGTGVSMPRGVTIDATLGKTGLVGQTLSVIYDDLVDVEHSVDPAYRPQGKFMFHDSTLKVIKKIKDSGGRPLWRSSLEGIGVSVGSNPDTINGYPYVINNDMPVFAANAKSVLFGDFSNYMIRDVLGVEVIRLVERYAEFNQVAFIAWARSDGALIDAGTHPVAYYANSAT
jgi:HK97 family phage major capsid protein